MQLRHAPTRALLLKCLLIISASSLAPGCVAFFPGLRGHDGITDGTEVKDFHSAVAYAKKLQADIDSDATQLSNTREFFRYGAVVGSVGSAIAAAASASSSIVLGFGLGSGTAAVVWSAADLDNKTSILSRGNAALSCLILAAENLGSPTPSPGASKVSPQPANSPPSANAGASPLENPTPAEHPNGPAVTPTPLQPNPNRSMLTDLSAAPLTAGTSAQQNLLSTLGVAPSGRAMAENITAVTGSDLQLLQENVAAKLLGGVSTGRAAGGKITSPAASSPVATAALAASAPLAQSLNAQVSALNEQQTISSSVAAAMPLFLVTHAYAIWKATQDQLQNSGASLDSVIASAKSDLTQQTNAKTAANTKVTTNAQQTKGQISQATAATSRMMLMQGGRAAVSVANTVTTSFADTDAELDAQIQSTQADQRLVDQAAACPGTAAPSAAPPTTKSKPTS
jgi:hypothetical protein